jgi:essential nuclear protein 1
LPGKCFNFTLDPELVNMYDKVGSVLSRYKSGKIPKAFKIIPTLKNWEEVLAITSPQNWTPNAMLEATSIFASNLPPKVAEKYACKLLLLCLLTGLAFVDFIETLYWRT